MVPISIALLRPATDICSVYNLGAIIGALCAGYLADRYGREMVFMVSSLVCAFGTVIQLSSVTLPQWIAGHVVLGLGIGACVTGIPIYISEIAPHTHRGRMMAMGQLAYQAGFHAHPHWWRLALAPELLLAFVLCVECYSFAPPSPHWLVAKGRDSQALEVLDLLHGDDLAEQELEQIQETFEAERHLNLSWTAFWKNPILGLMTLACGVKIIQQINGTHSIMSLTPSLFERRGLCVADDCLFGIISIFAMEYHSTWCTQKWFDRWSRKTWLQVGTIVMVLSLLMTHVLELKIDQHPDWYGRYMLIPLPFLFYIFHNLSWAIAGSTYVSEIFPMSLRAKGIALSTALGWALKYFAEVSPSLGDAIGRGSCSVYTMIGVLAFVFARYALVERKDRSLEEITQLLLPDYFSDAEGAAREEMELLNHKHTE
ncbi:general substrate transporter [Aspergillus germanicus]